jgi:tubulin polyglutamylase TTLL6/13
MYPYRDSVTNYPVVKEVAKSLGIRVIDDKEEINWDVCWTDYPITPETFIRMHFHQTINYIPGIYTIARKNELGKRLNLMQNVFPK